MLFKFYIEPSIDLKSCCWAFQAKLLSIYVETMVKLHSEHKLLSGETCHAHHYCASVGSEARVSFLVYVGVGKTGNFYLGCIDHKRECRVVSFNGYLETRILFYVTHNLPTNSLKHWTPLGFSLYWKLMERANCKKTCRNNTLIRLSILLANPTPS